MSITKQTRRESYEKLDNATIYSRIINILEGGRELTAKEIALIMYERHYIPFPVRQAVAPRLTELEEKGIVEAAGKAYDHETKRSVALYRLVRS